MANITDQLGQAFVCPRCHNKGGTAQKLAMSGTGFRACWKFNPTVTPLSPAPTAATPKSST